MKKNRTISRLIKAGFMSILMLSGQMASSAQERRPVEMIKVADGVYAFIDYDATREFVFGNSIAVIGDDGVLIFDSNQLPSLARRVLAEVRRLTEKPVRFVVNSHWHWDHTMGNQVYLDAFPQVEIIAHSETRREGDIETSKMLGFVTNHKAEFLKGLKDTLEAGKHHGGKPLTAQEKVRVRQLINDVETYYEEFKTARYLSPTLTFEDKLTLHLGKREIQLLHPGKGNTSGDVVAYLPKEKVLLTGDLLVHPIPYSFGSFLPEWIQALERLSKLELAAIVPGHGPVQRDNEYLKLVSRLLESVVTQVQESVNRGLSLEEAREALKLDSFRLHFTGDDPERNHAFKHYFVLPATERVYKQLKSKTVKQ